MKKSTIEYSLIMSYNNIIYNYIIKHCILSRAHRGAHPVVGWRAGGVRGVCGIGCVGARAAWGVV